MLRNLAAYLIAVVAFGALDAVWLTQSFAHLYQPQIGQLTHTPEPVASLAFYLIYIFGMTRFGIVPSLGRATGSRNVVIRALINGACFGFVAYATYDLTNLATLKGWTLTISLADMAWGTFATAVASAITTALTRRIFKA